MTAPIAGLETTETERKRLLAQAVDRRAQNDIDVGSVERLLRDFDRLFAHANANAETDRAAEAEDELSELDASVAYWKDLAHRAADQRVKDAEARYERAEAALRLAADNLTEASRAVERASGADPKTVARLALHVEKMAIAARAALTKPEVKTKATSGYGYEELSE